MGKEYKLTGGNGTTIEELEVTEDGTYTAGDSRAFNPVIVRTGGGGGGALVLEGEWHSDGDETVCIFPWTYAERLTAVQAGKTIVFHIPESQTLRYPELYAVSQTARIEDNEGEPFVAGCYFYDTKLEQMKMINGDPPDFMFYVPEGDR